MNPFDYNKDGSVNRDDVTAAAKDVGQKLKTAWYQDPIAILIFCGISFFLGVVLKKMFF